MLDELVVNVGGQLHHLLQIGLANRELVLLDFVGVLDELIHLRFLQIGKPRLLLPYLHVLASHEVLLSPHHDLVYWSARCSELLWEILLDQ